MNKVVLVGESNPYGADPHFALYPAPDGCAGHRLCCLILGMSRHDYLCTFERVNLCTGKWSIRDARTEAIRLLKVGGRFILLGSKVSSGFGLTFTPFQQQEGGTFLILPHPSGLCRLWNRDTFEQARQAVVNFEPALATLVGKRIPEGGVNAEEPQGTQRPDD